MTYRASNINATIDTISLGSAYDSMLLSRLQSEEFLPVNCKEYYTFSLHGTTANAHSLRFSLNASSVDACYAVFRDGKYMSNGIKMQASQGASLTDAHCSNAFYLNSFTDPNTTRGSFKSNLTCATVNYPPYSAALLD